MAAARRPFGSKPVGLLRAEFLLLLPAILDCARVQAAHLTSWHDREDAIADAVAAAWERLIGEHLNLGANAAAEASAAARRNRATPMSDRRARLQPRVIAEVVA